MNFKLTLLHLVLITSVFSVSACTKDPSNPELNKGDVRDITSDCGIVQKGKLVNPVKAENGTPVTIEQIIGVDIASVRNDNTGESMLVKFHSLEAGEVPAAKQFEGRAMLEQEFGRLALFYKADDDCELELEGGEKARIGQLVKREDGESFNEALLKGGYAIADNGNSVCGGDFLKTCYQALEETPAQQQATIEDNEDDETSINDLIELLQELDESSSNFSGGGSAANQFLWKPVSESNGKLVILHQRGIGVKATIVYKSGGKVRTDTGSDSGPSNGYDATIRFSKRGCDYGKNIKVNIGGKTYSVKDGCNRVEVR
ncbi:MAG: hypothetical protein KDD56_05315 [Bdellovibrionales bacterium]|nr:hypothetical protein [Bdellovibrionales bacterium]